jgi:DNA repair exonuclease SbcCD nuclease subunit
MTKILFIGDPHFKIKNVEYIPLFISKITTIVESNTLDFVVIAGDVLDNHDRVDVEPLNLAINFILQVSQKIKTFILVGNHDYKNNQQFLTDHHWMNAFKHWNNVVVVDQVVQLNEFLFVPYVPPGRFLEALKTKISIEDLNKFKAIFAHQEFFGCKMGPITSTDGDKWKKKWPLVVSGHIHNKQWSQSNIYYPGSCVQHAFGQSIENTVSILTFEEDELSYEEIDLKMPKLLIKYMSVDDALKPLKFKNKEFRKYKIVLQGTQEEFQTFKKNKRYKELLEEGFKIAFKLKKIQIFETCNDLKKNFIDILHEKVDNEDDLTLKEIMKKFLQN